MWKVVWCDRCEERGGHEVRAPQQVAVALVVPPVHGVALPVVPPTVQHPVERPQQQNVAVDHQDIQHDVKYLLLLSGRQVCIQANTK